MHCSCQSEDLDQALAYICLQHPQHQLHAEVHDLRQANNVTSPDSRQAVGLLHAMPRGAAPCSTPYVQAMSRTAESGPHLLPVAAYSPE